jgi:hypothetical protein
MPMALCATQGGRNHITGNKILLKRFHRVAAGARQGGISILAAESLLNVLKRRS